MSTRSMIGKTESDGTITAIYCHSDGYPQYVGRILIDHYTAVEKIDALLALGALSGLGPEIGDKHPLFHRSDAYNPETGTYDPYPPEWDQWCAAYERDRGDGFWQSRGLTREAWPDVAEGYDAEFVYLWDGTAWQYALVKGRYPHMVFTDWRPVVEALAAESEPIAA